MKILRFEYNYRLEFDRDIQDQQFLLRCIPREGIHQKILEIDYTISPIDQVIRLKDGFNNSIYVGSSLKPHNYFSFVVKGRIAIDHGQQDIKEKSYSLYKYMTPLTDHDQNIENMAKPYQYLDDHKKSIALMHQVYRDMIYTPNATSIYTTAKEAYTLGQGVCQDYAHILISALRYLNVPSRYVAGMMIGEGASHAWVEAYVNEHWIGLDPTNNKIVDEGYIKLSHGRDYRDCVIDKGRFIGNCRQRQYVNIVVEEEKSDDVDK